MFMRYVTPLGAIIIMAKTHFLPLKFAKVAILAPIKKNGKSDPPCLPPFAKRQF